MTFSTLMAWINLQLHYWMQMDWHWALLLATLVHLSIYLIGGGVGWLLTRQLWPAIGLGREIDLRPLKPGQLTYELRNGLLACLLFGVISLSYRSLCVDLWPQDAATALWQLAAFVVFNNLYSYGTHRLLHHRYLIRFHAVHHRSVRVTPFSSYSVHGLEAIVIAATFPLFLLLVPMSLGMVVLLHAFGMTYTVCIHCNYDLWPALSDHHWFKKLINHPTYHRYHHTLGNVNYGFTNRLLDILFKTNKD
ncbi:sterol desaturase family protein [Undibacterium sp. Di24W]|uniref:sterol desaturase family protein n=1 Tax=Undibacterium sp. Di24W TaxID=3413033 RepID=UPI003BF37EB7